MSSEYGWTLDYILDYIHIDELFGLIDNIRRRKASEALLSLSIVHNPHSEKPNMLFNELRSVLVGSNKYEDVIDREGLEKLKRDLSKKSKFIKIKK